MTLAVIIIFIIITNGGVIMTYINEKLQIKIALMNAKKTLKQFSHLELIEFEKYDSHWLELFESQLKLFRKIDSIPKYSKPFENGSDSMTWLENALDFLKEKKEWLILVTNYPHPVWANIKVLNFTEGLEELWGNSNYHELIIADKSTGRIAQVFSEEENYEIHVGKCELTNVKRE